MRHIKPVVLNELKQHERQESAYMGYHDGETQYGMHVGLDAHEQLFLAQPHEMIGKPKGDNNRGVHQGYQIDPFLDCVD